MIISHTHKYIFVKSAKTAGTSIEAALSSYCEGDDIVTPLGNYRVNRDESGQWVHRAMNPGDFQQHEWGASIRDKVGPEVWESYFKFSIARNPWDRVVSLFTWKARNDASLKPRRRFYHRLGVPFDEFAEVKKRFAEFVKAGDWQTNDRFYILDGKLGVDFIIHYEDLAAGFAEVCQRLGLPQMALPRLKAGIRPTKYHYSQYYDEETKDIVADRHRNDIELLGYRFERV